MKIKKMVAGLAVCAIAASAMSVSCFAAITNANAEDGGGTYVYDVMANLPAGCSLTDVYGATFTFTGFDETAGTGGGFTWNSGSTGWAQEEWGNEGSDKAISFTADNLSCTRLETEPVFAASDEFAQVVIAQWNGWGADITIDSVILLGADGKALGGAAETDAPAETTATPAETTKAPAATTAGSGSGSGSANTGVEGVAAVAAILAIAGAAAVVTRKKN